MLGIRRGWEGLTHGRVRGDGNLDPEYIRILDRISTRTIDRTGGTVLHTSRTNPRKMPVERLPAWLSEERRAALQADERTYDLTPLVLEHIARARARLAGDDRRRRHAVASRGSWPTDGVPLIAIPKTMDNDVQGTEYCIGFSSAITRAKELINRQRTTLGSHERIGVFRIFGRDCGFSALFTAYVTSARCVIPEAPYDLDRAGRRARGGPRRQPVATTPSSSPPRARSGRAPRCADVGDADAFGHRHKANIGEALATELRPRTGIETVASELTYDLRSGEPDMLDQMVAMTFANVAMDLIWPTAITRPDGGDPRRQVRPRAAARPGPRRAPGRRRRRCTTWSASGRGTTARLGEPLLLSAPLVAPVAG